MNAAYALETENWEHEMNRVGIKKAEMSTVPGSAYWFVKGMAALEKDNLAAARQALAQMKEKTNASQKAKEDKGAESLRLELAALIQHKQGNQEEAIDLLKQAIEIEEQMPLDFGPPWPMKPSHELFGEVLLELNRPEEARKQFELALKRTPRRTSSLLGLARAAGRAGDSEIAHRTYSELNEIWRNADNAISALDEVRSALELTQAGSE
jgi:tetratricopeptide (TPR) repeat protein